MSRLMAVTHIDYRGNYAFAPPTDEAVINLDEIVAITTIRPENTRSSYALVKVRFRDGSTLDVIGKPSDFMEVQP